MTDLPTPINPTRAIRKARVLELTGISTATLYRLIARGDFPRPTKLTERVSAWDEQAVLGWLAARFAR